MLGDRELRREAAEMGPSGKLSGYGYLRGKNGNVCGGGRGKRSSTGVTSVVKALMESQVTGKGLKSIRQLPRGGYCRFQTSSKNMAPLCMDLENGLVSNHVEACQRVLSNLLYSICEWNNPHYQQNREAFVLFGGDVLLLRALFYPFSSEDGIEKLGSSKVLAVRRDCLSLLRELCFTVPFFPEGLAANGDFVIKLFAFMGNITTFDQGQSLLTHISHVCQVMLILWHRSGLLESPLVAHTSYLKVTCAFLINIASMAVVLRTSDC